MDLSYCCPTCEAYKRTWGFGDVQVGLLLPESAAYIAGYVTKKLTGSMEITDGREREFARMSNRPGIGHDALYELVNTLFRDQVDCSADVPGSLRHGSKVDPLGRYLRKKLRVMVGRDEAAPQANIDAMDAKMQDVRLAARESSVGLKKEILKAFEGEYEKFKARQLMFKSRRSL